MNKFFIEDVELEYDIDSSDIFSISSSIKDYTVEIEDGPIVKLIESCYQKGNIAVIDGNVYSLYFEDINLVVDPKDVFIVNAVESNKTVKTAFKLIDFLRIKKFNKKNKMIVIGGGITQDIGSFVGACYKRGFDWTFIPTTLLAQCDSCIGSKSGLNYKDSKNQIGMFSPPSEIKINTNFLKTLTQEEIKSGLGEILKVYQMAGSHEIDFYLKHIKNAEINNFSSWKNLIKKSLLIKKSIVEYDELEKDKRRALNYGHTIGHAIEIISDYKIPHGQAVSIGMYVSNKINNTSNQEIESCLLDTITDKQFLKFLNLDTMREVLIEDKKSVGENIMMVWVDYKNSKSTLSYVNVDKLIKETKNVISSMLS